MPLSSIVIPCVALLMTFPVFADLRVIEEGGAYTILKENTALAVFQVKAENSEKDPARLQYIHPLYWSDGRVLTENAPDDHIHQRGIFWAWRQIRVGGKQAANSWLLEDILYRPVAHNAVLHTDSHATIYSSLVWEVVDPLASDGNTIPVIEEKASVSVSELAAGALKYDFTIELSALRPDVEIGGAPNAKGYGGFSARLAGAPFMSFADMQGKAHEPTPEPVATSGPIIMRFDKGSEFEDLQISMECAVNDKPIESWILRRELSMQNCVWPGRHPVKIAMDVPVILKASLVLKQTRQTPE